MKTRYSILLVDDDRDDLEVMQEAFNTIPADKNVLTASNGEEAIQRLLKLDDAGLLPSLIVLDINMPRMDGRQTVAAIKGNKRLSAIPIVVYSTSNRKSDVLFFAAYGVELKTKPHDYKEVIEMASKLLQYAACSV